MFQPVHLTVVPEAAQVELGGQLTLSLTIRNASRMVTGFRIDVSGIPRDWYDLDQTRATLAPFSHERLHLTVHPTAGTATPAGSYAITVHVTAEDDPTNQASTVVALTVDSGAWLDMDVQPAEVEGPEATFRITFVNRSHTAVPVRLAASDREDRLSFRMAPDDTVIVPAGAAADPITVHVVPKVRETVGKPHRHQLEFRGLLLGSEHASNPYLEGQARFTHVARYAPRWQPAWLRGLPGWVALLPLAVLLMLGAWTGGHTLLQPTTTPRTSNAIVGTIVVGRDPAAVEMEKTAGHAFVLNRAGNTVTMLNTATRAVLRSVAVGQDPIAISVDSTLGRAFVVNQAGNTVSILDTTTGRVLHTSAVGHGPSAIGRYSSRRINQAFVANTASDTISMLDAKTGAVLRTIPVGQDPAAMDVDKTTGRVFIANTGSDTVSVLDDKTGRVLRTIPVGKHPIDVVKDAVNAQAFVVNRAGNTLTVLGGNLG